MYNNAKAHFEDFPPVYLTERRKVRTGKSPFEKYAADMHLENVLSQNVSSKRKSWVGTN
jgi:hypothetical protein